MRHTYVMPIRWQERTTVALSSMGSSYYTRLETTAKNRYAETLMSVGLSIEEDPFLPKNGNRFADSLSNWPQTEFGHIFTYLVSRAGVYTQKLNSCFRGSKWMPTHTFRQDMSGLCTHSDLIIFALPPQHFERNVIAP